MKIISKDRKWTWPVLLVLFGVWALVLFYYHSKNKDYWRDSGGAANGDKFAPEPAAVARFTRIPAQPGAKPEVTRLFLPNSVSGDSIWGATGHDSRGHVWFGVSLEHAATPSAHLVEYVPETGKMIDRGDVVSALKRCGVYRKGEGQGKIHSRIYEGQDGHLYFASMDIQGTRFDEGAQPPLWGGHFWRLRLPDNIWEHLKSVPEGLIAIAGNRRCIYALGFFGHKLFQLDLETSNIRSVMVGAAGGHISRNFFSDPREHVYVPRLWYDQATGAVNVTLVEYDRKLREIAQTPLPAYVVHKPSTTHGIVSFQHMADESIYFITHAGRLYHVVPGEGKTAAEVSDCGWFHPEGQRYVASLFTYAGERYLLGLSTQDKDTGANKLYEWVVRDMAEESAEVMPFPIDGIRGARQANMLLYGSMTRDGFGNFYVVGTDYANSDPLALQVRTPSGKSGSLTMTLTPEEALAKGAEWRLDDGPWLKSGATVEDLLPGAHGIDYRDAVVWTPPPSEVVVIGPDKIVSLTRAYRETTEAVVDNQDDTEHRRFRVILGKWATRRWGKKRWNVNNRRSDARYVATSDALETARAEWRCTILPAGEYDVYAWWPVSKREMGQSVGLDILHAKGTTPFRVDQNQEGGEWSYLGRYTFEAGSHAVQIHNGFSGLGTHIVADAVRFVKFAE